MKGILFYVIILIFVLVFAGLIYRYSQKSIQEIPQGEIKESYKNFWSSFWEIFIAIFVLAVALVVYYFR